jgi:DNA-binding MarR family transcriptional regulator
LCDTTVAVVNSTPDDAQLEQLLTQLLRAVSPAFGVRSPENGPTPRARDGEAAESESGAADTAVLTSSPAQGYAPPVPAGARHSDADRANPTASAVKLPSVSGSEARALIELMSARGIAQGELAGLLGLDKSTVSRLAAGLERKGWIRRGRDQGNQRYVRLYLTADGGAVATRVLQAWHSRQARILAALSEDERAGLSAGLRGLVRGLAAEGLLGESADNGS